MVTAEEINAALAALNPGGDKRAARAALDATLLYFQGKSLNESQKESIAAKGGASSAAHISIPRSLIPLFMPEFGQYCGKGLPVTSNGVSGQNLVQGTLLAEAGLLRPAGEPPAIFPRALKVPAQGGTGFWPQLTESAPGAQDGPHEFDEYGVAICDWSAEAAEATSDDPQFDKQAIPCFEITAYTEMSAHLFRVASNVLDVMALMRAILRPAMLHKIDHALMSGDGIGRPQGYLNLNGIGEVNRAVANEIAYDDVIDVEMKLPPQFRANAAFVLSESAYKYLRKKKDSANRPLYPELGGPQPKLKGYPAIATQRGVALGTRGDVSFGDFGQYVCAMEEEFNVMLSHERKPGLVCVRGAMLLGGKGVRPRAFATLV